MGAFRRGVLMGIPILFVLFLFGCMSMSRGRVVTEVKYFEGVLTVEHCDLEQDYFEGMVKFTHCVQSRFNIPEPK